MGVIIIFFELVNGFFFLCLDFAMKFVNYNEFVLCLMFLVVEEFYIFKKVFI